MASELAQKAAYDQGVIMQELRETLLRYESLLSSPNHTSLTHG